MSLYAQEQSPIIHTVEKGNTIYSLSREYKVSILDIKNWNDMKNNNLSVGDKLIVGYKTEVEQIEEVSEVEKKEEVTDPEIVEKTSIEEKKEVQEATSMQPKDDKENQAPASLEDLGTNIDDENIYNISLETVENPKTTETRDLGNSMALPKPTSLVFCGGVENGIPIGVSTVFYAAGEAGYFYVFLENQDQFDDIELIVELYQKEPFSKRFNNHKGTRKYSIKARWKYTNFKYDIPEAGEYRMMVFNSEKEKMAEGFFVILEK